MKIKVNVANLPKPRLQTQYRYPKPVEYPDDAVIVIIDKHNEPIKKVRDWSGRNRKDLWTDEMKATAWDMLMSGKPIEEVAEAVGKGVNATYSMLCRIRQDKGLKIEIRPRSDTYTAEQDAAIIKGHKAGKSMLEIAKIIGRSKQSVKYRVTVLRRRGLIKQDNRKVRH